MQYRQRETIKPWELWIPYKNCGIICIAKYRKKKVIERMYKAIVLIPCYNEENSIEKVVDKLLKCHCFNCSSEHGYTIDYIVINDCSNDRTKEI